MSDAAIIMVRCACGWTTTGPTDDVIERTRGHGLQVHNMAATDEQILAMAMPVPEGAEDEAPAAT